MKPANRLVLAMVLICFWFSGMAGLVYQIVWARYLALLRGHKSYAVVAVLVAFMGGLALGNAWLGGRADRSPRPFRLYAWLEMGIGLYALAFPAYYSLCHASFVALARHLTPGGSAVLALKFAFSFLTILLPTVMMGATFPVLTRFVTRSLAELRQRVAALYAINSAGAVAGCLAADFWWIPAHGLQANVFAGAAINLAVGVVAWGLSAWIRERTEAELPARSADFQSAVSPISNRHGDDTSRAPDPGEAPQAGSPAIQQIGNLRHTAASEELLTRSELKLALLGIGLSGFVAMLYEVAWTRMLALALGSSTHAFSLMVATIITGITGGAWLVSRWKNPRRTLEAFALAELALAGTLLGSMFFYERLPFWFARLAMLLARREEAYPLYELLQALICFAVMFVPTVCLGMTLLLVSRLATQELSRNGPFVAAAEGPVHGDFHPRLEFLAQRAFFVSEQTEKWRLLDENTSPRSTTLLADYLKKHPLAEADLADFARFQTAQGTLRAEVFQSLLLRWQRDFPGTLRAHKLSMQTWEEGSLAELAARRLAPLREAMLRQLPKDPELLQFYARFMMQANREQRSAFHIPNSAELAWDRSDDDECLRLGREAFTPGAAGGGLMNFTRDPQAPRLVLTRMMESLGRIGRKAEAQKLFHEVLKIRLVSGDPADMDPRLELVCRKAEVRFDSGQAPKPPQAATPSMTTTKAKAAL